MEQKEIQETIERYNARLKEHGISEQALGWGEKGRAKLRYEILLSQWNFNEQSVLDFGCGFGDLYDYILLKEFKNTKYTGIDINKNFIEIATEKHKDKATFILKNLIEDKFEDQYDFVLSSGVFNHKLDDNLGFIKKCFEKFNQLSKKGFALNFLSDKVSVRYDYTFHADPAAILNLAYQYSNNVVLRNDYMPFEFTVFVNKFSAVDEKLTVYNEFVKYV